MSARTLHLVVDAEQKTCGRCRHVFFDVGFVITCRVFGVVDRNRGSHLHLWEGVRVPSCLEAEAIAKRCESVVDAARTSTNVGVIRDELTGDRLNRFIAESCSAEDALGTAIAALDALNGGK